MGDRQEERLRRSQVLQFPKHWLIGLRTCDEASRARNRTNRKNAEDLIILKLYG